MICKSTVHANNPSVTAAPRHLPLPGGSLYILCSSTTSLWWGRFEVGAVWEFPVKPFIVHFILKEGYASAAYPSFQNNKDKISFYIDFALTGEYNSI